MAVLDGQPLTRSSSDNDERHVTAFTPIMKRLAVGHASVVAVVCCVFRTMSSRAEESSANADLDSPNLDVDFT